MTTSTDDLIRARMQEHRDEVTAIKDATAAQSVEREALLRQRDEIDAKIAALSVQINARQPELIEAKKGIAACARALGSKALSG